MDGVWNANPITCIRPPIHQPMPCHAISYFIILHHSISAHAMIFNTIPSHTIFPSTNTALTIWVLSSCALCFWPGVHCTLCTQWCGVHCTIVAHTAGGQVCILQSVLIWNIYHRLLIRSRLSLRNTICFGNSNNASQCKVTECNTNINICIFLHSIEAQCNRFLLSICYCNC